MELLEEIGKQSPIIGVLIFFIWYFMRVVDKKDRRIEELSKFIVDEQKEFSEQQREDQREMLDAVANMTKSMEKFIELIRYENRKT